MTPEKARVLDVAFSISTQILGFWAIQAASTRDLKRYVAAQNAKDVTEDGTNVPIRPSPSVRERFSSWRERQRPWYHFSRAPYALLGLFSLVWMCTKGIGQGLVDWACVVGFYVVLVFAVDTTSGVFTDSARHRVPAAPEIASRAPSLSPSTSLRTETQLLSSTRTLLDYPVTSLIIPVIPLFIFYHENPAVKPCTVAALSTAGAIYAGRLLEDVSFERRFKYLNSYNALVMFSLVIGVLAPKDLGAKLADILPSPMPSPWIRQMLLVFPATIPAILPALLISRALRYDYIAHLVSSPGPDPEAPMTTAAEDTTDIKKPLLNPHLPEKLPEFPEPTYRLACFTWMGSTIFIFVLGLLVVPGLLDPGREYQWPVVLVPAVGAAMILRVRRSGLSQLLAE